MPIASTVRLGKNVRIYHEDQVNLYGCTVGDESRIGSFVEIQKNATIGARCKVSSHSFICEEVTIEDEVFIGHGVMFTNDRFPRATNPDGMPWTEADWELKRPWSSTAPRSCNATILSGLRVEEGALIAAGRARLRDCRGDTCSYNRRYSAEDGLRSLRLSL